MARRVGLRRPAQRRTLGKLKRSISARRSGDASWQKFATIGSVVTAIGALLFTGLTYSAGRVQDEQNRDGQLVNRFSTATTQLGAGTAEERLGGIYALKRLAADSPRDRRTVHEVLAGFVRSRSSISSVGGAEACRKRTQLDTDVQAALDALANRAESGSGGLVVVDLRETCLAGARFEGADLTNANMAGVVLAGARITGKIVLRMGSFGGFSGPRQFLDKPSDFSGADLTGADLSGARVMGAVFKDALLGRADLRGIEAADFGGGLVYPALDSKIFTMEGNGKSQRIALASEVMAFKLGLFFDDAYLGYANFAGTDLGDTSFRGASLMCTNFTDANVEDAWFDGSGDRTDEEMRETIKAMQILCG